MTDPAQVQAWIESIRFRPTLGSGYDMGEVDQLLEELAAAARQGRPVAELIEARRLGTVGLRQKYDRDEVDAFLAHLASGVDDPPASLAVPTSSHPVAQQVLEARFSPVRLREGYLMGDVDELLDRLVEAIEAGSPLRPLVQGARLGRTRLREGYDLAEVDRFLADVVARAGLDG